MTETTVNVAAMQRRVEAWVRTRFGAANMDRRERAARLLEEAIELAQAEGMDEPEVQRLTGFVYAKPRGEPAQEAAGVGVGLLGWAAAADENAWCLILHEVARIESKPIAHFAARHKIKSDAGVAMKATKEPRS